VGKWPVTCFGYSRDHLQGGKAKEYKYVCEDYSTIEIRTVLSKNWG